MVLTISTNTSALSVQKNLNKANEASASSLAKLSSGSRVPTAKDDAASLAIGSRVEAEIAGLKQASTNASQATSLLQIADGAYGEINSILVRQSTLAIQSASGQLSDSERAIINSEFHELTDEIDRISGDTEFNGNQLLNGGSIIVSTDEEITGGLASKGMELSYDATKVNPGDKFAVSYDSGNQKVTLENKTTGEKTVKDISEMMEKATGDATTGTDLGAGKEIAVEFKDAGITVNLTDDFDRSESVVVGKSLAGTMSTTGTAKFGDSTIALASGVTKDDLDVLDTSTAYADGKLTLSVGSGAAVTADGLAVTIVASDNSTSSNMAAGDKSMTISKDGKDLFTVTFSTATAGADGDTLVIDFNDVKDTVFTTSQTTETQAKFEFKVGTGTEGSDNIHVSIDSVTSQALGIEKGTISVDTKDNADDAIKAIKTAIDNLQGSRAQIGASLSRLGFASSNLAVAIENQSAAKSGLLDVDVASETTNFAAQQVVVQAGVSLLAQANQKPQQLLKLIG